MALSVQYSKVISRNKTGVSIQILDGTTIVNQQFVPNQANMDIVLKAAAQALLANSVDLATIDAAITITAAQVK